MNHKEPIKYLSLFSGIGGFELGINQAYEIIRNFDVQEVGGGQEDTEREHEKRGGLLSVSSVTTLPTHNGDNEHPDGSTYKGQPHCVGFSEIDKYATQIYQEHFPNHKPYGDITKINEKELPDFDLLVGGFPCQAFSIAGKRGGFEDTRGTMFFEIARIVREKQPRLLLLENVKGLLSHDSGKTFRTIIRTLDELGYDCQWQVLNSKNHGVPQNRERVFIIGHLRGTSRPQVFPFTGTDPKIDKTKKLPEQISNCLRTNYSNGKSNELYIRQLNKPKHSNDRVYGKDGLSPTLNTAQGGNRQPFIPEDPKIRRLTPTECARLQGFPDDWHEGLSDTQAYKCYGNAVTVNVIKDIMLKLL